MTAPFDFVPLEEERPDKDSVVSLEVRNPDFEVERVAYEAVLTRNPFADHEPLATHAPRLTTSADELLRTDELCIASAGVTLVVGYPFPGRYAVAVTAPTQLGFTHADLFRAIVSVHQAMYDGATFGGAARSLHNPRVDSPRFGIAYHRFEDLVIEHVLVVQRPDGEVYAWISIGS